MVVGETFGNVLLRKCVESQNERSPCDGIGSEWDNSSNRNGESSAVAPLCPQANLALEK